MSIAIEPFTHHHRDVVYQITRAAWEADVADIPHPSPAAFAAMLESSWPAHSDERYVAFLDGVAVGFLRLRMPQADNLANVDVEVVTAPGHRRRGVGRAMLGHAVRRARALGRAHLMSSTVDHIPDGAAFALAMGANAGLAETRSRLDVPPPDQDRLDALLADCWRHAAGYRLVQWTGVAPEDYLGDVARLESRLVLDAPMGELPMEPEKIDADRARANDEHRIALGRTPFQTGAVHEASDRMVAWTMIAGHNDTPVHAWQNITIVDPDHRGRRLGLIVKLENLRYIRGLRPELTGIDTINASANRHMLAINETMGFRRVDQWVQWQLTV
jgi:GNAT superfamily N-acetyltransferase